jgi:hypothetical protein
MKFCGFVPLVFVCVQIFPICSYFDVYDLVFVSFGFFVCTLLELGPTKLNTQQSS